MKPFNSFLTLLLISVAIYWSFKAEKPNYVPDEQIEKSAFSTDRALKHVENISKKPHAVGSADHKVVRNYIIKELNKLGLETQIQEGYTAGDWANYSKAVNILTRIKGSEDGEALVLMSHYDSSPHSSLGASDAGSGVATILEGIRAFLSKGITPKSDIIILITDAEELGLNGADLFVNQHEWAKEIGLVLNFEARGSGGTSFMLLETNKGNAGLIKEFVKANPDYPAANSLMYSIYKMLPNDTDLTVFREDGDIQGFNFAFIDDHFDYHTVRDNYNRLDRNTLAHQGSYLMPLLQHFSSADLNNLRSKEDLVYFNVPLFKLVTYPFSWIWPMFAIAVCAFVLLLFYGFKTKSLNLKAVAIGFIPMLLSFAIPGVIGYFSWPFLKWMYPGYQDILQGFTYNGHAYIYAFVFLTLAICFSCYHRFKKTDTKNLFIAPIFLWLLICGALSYYLKGGVYFIIPVFTALAALMVLINQKKPNPFLLVFLSIPAIWIFSPFIAALPIGLGLKMMLGSMILTALTFSLLLPLIGFYRNKNNLALLSLVLFAFFMIKAHLNADFSEENAKPTSLAYILNSETNRAYWATYDNVLSDWTSNYIDKTTTSEDLNVNIIKSKYKTGFSFVSEAPIKHIKPPLVETSLDTIIGNERILELCITHQRSVNRLEIFTGKTFLNAVKINGIAIEESHLGRQTEGRLLTHYISNNEYTELQIAIPKVEKLALTFYEASNDLLEHPEFSLPERPKNNIPMPFVINDAIITIKEIRFE
ncbi:M20/M25/M40 family metallo-hydrolase [Aurantibacter crassamenti]|uniref:M28 family peptidase n=1 Tax=Aurantibacter crassamenti TaxID=1837375 RepID=UPI00193A4643|nr:M28 family peptidase [Aurantibacter crassamenti]MBM1105498.1 M20/M25/M40 family metallo-hydrolase [Aurantibacter crassamenti]